MYAKELEARETGAARRRVASLHPNSSPYPRRGVESLCPGSSGISIWIGSGAGARQGAFARVLHTKRVYIQSGRALYLSLSERADIFVFSFCLNSRRGHVYGRIEMNTLSLGFSRTRGEKYGPAAFCSTGAILNFLMY